MESKNSNKTKNQTKTTMEIERFSYDFPNRPALASKYSTTLKKVEVHTNHFPLKFDFSNSKVYSYHLEIKPDIPEDSR